MKNYKTILLLVGAAFLVVSCAPMSNSALVSVPSSHERTVAEQIFKLVNIERVKVGRKPLRGIRALNAMAQKHSEFQATSSVVKNETSNIGSQNRAQYAYLKHGIENLTEIVSVVPASNPDPAGTVVNAWKKSAEHSRHIKQTWDLTGIGVYESDNGKVYITMMLGVRPSGVPRSMQAGR